MSKSKIAIQFFAAIGILVTGLIVGGGGRYLYDYLSNREPVEVAEVVTTSGKSFTVLPYIPESDSQRENVEQALGSANIDYITKKNTVLVAPGDTTLAMDCLSAANLIPGTEHFSFMDITASKDSEPRRYAFQQRLANQNVLSKMIPTMLSSVSSAKVWLSDNAAKVRVALKPGEVLSATDLKMIIEHVNAIVPAVKPDNIKVYNEAALR